MAAVLFCAPVFLAVFSNLPFVSNPEFNVASLYSSDCTLVIDYNRELRCFNSISDFVHIDSLQCLHVHTARPACAPSLGQCTCVLFGQRRTPTPFVSISPVIFDFSDIRLYYPAGLPVFRAKRHATHVVTRPAVLIAFLLLIGNIEPNPGPAATTSPLLNVGLMNARSAVHKAALIHDVVTDHRLDLAVITETWIPSDAPDVVKLDISPKGYHVLHQFRGTSADGRGGGIAVVHRQTVDLSVANLGKYSAFESLCVRINSSPFPIIVACIYRPPGAVTTTFCDQLSELLDQLMLSGLRYVVCGDLNCPGNNTAVIDHRLLEVLTCHNQRQLVTQPTHNAGNVLDLLIVPDCWSDLVSDVAVHSLCFTDHSLISWRLGIRREKPVRITYSFRRIKQIDLSDFHRRILESQLCKVLDVQYSADEYTELFEAEVTRVLDACAPIRSVTKRSGSHDCRRLSADARAAKRACRRAERRYRRTGSDIDRLEFNRARRLACQLIDSSHVSHIKNEVAASAGNPRRLWRTTKQLLHPAPPYSLNDGECARLTTVFCQFFTDKVANILTSVQSVVHSLADCSPFTTRSYSGQPLAAFSTVSTAEVLKLINKLPNKSSPRDALPTSLLKSSAEIFAPIIARLANLSFSTGVFPAAFKTAQVLPLLKKTGLDRSVPANYIDRSQS